MIPRTMRAIAIDRFGAVDEMQVQTLPVPEPGPGDVLIRLEFAGVGEWDPFEREGGFKEMMPTPPRFPYVLGSEGAGTVTAVGAQVTRFKPDDRVYAMGFLHPRGGFYAEYVAVSENLVSPIPGTLSMEEASAVGGVGITALRGLDDTLSVKAGESVMIFGASGGVGHVAVQLAKRMGARVFAVASGEDGVALVGRLGADAVADGHGDEVLEVAREFAPDGIDVALLTAGGDAADRALLALRKDGRAAYPNGVEPEPKAPDGIPLRTYDGEPDRDIMDRLDRLVEAGPFEVHIARTYLLEEAVEAHRALDEHYLGKIVLQVR